MRNKSQQQHLGRSRFAARLLCLAALTVAVSATAQTPKLRLTQPNLSTGQSVSGKEHPEYFSRRVAFQTCLELLSVQPEDAVHLQRRARLIEATRIGLGVDDMSALETIVEQYRVEERARRAQAALLIQRVPSAVAFTSLNQEHQAAMRHAVAAINTALSIDGRVRLNNFLDDIIAHSELHAPSTPDARKAVN